MTGCCPSSCGLKFHITERDHETVGKSTIVAAAEIDPFGTLFSLGNPISHGEVQLLRRFRSSRILRAVRRRDISVGCQFSSAVELASVR